MKVILEDYLMAISAAQERIQRCETAMMDRLSSWILRQEWRRIAFFVD